MKARRVERRLRRFIEEELLDVPYHGRDPLADQVVDSLALEQLVQHIEEEYGVRLGDGDVVPENFADLPTLAALIQSRR